MHVYTLSDMRSEKKLRVYTASEAKGLRNMFTVKRTCSVTQKIGQSLVKAWLIIHMYNYIFLIIDFNLFLGGGWIKIS